MCVGKHECIWEDLSKCSVESILEGQGSGQMSYGLWIITAGPLQNEHHTPAVAGAVPDSGRASCGSFQGPRTLTMGSHTPVPRLVMVRLPFISPSVNRSLSSQKPSLGALPPSLRKWNVTIPNVCHLALYFSRSWVDDSEHWKGDRFLLL